MVVVDTSVWVAVLRSAGAREAPAFAALLESDDVIVPILVRLELLAGVSSKERPRLRRMLSALPIAYPDEETWPLIDGWIERAVGQGQRFGLGDLLIAAVASQQGALVWSLDGDFERMERLKLVSLYNAK